MQNARWGALIVVLLAALYLCWLMLRPFLDVLLWAAVLVTLFFPVHLRVRLRTGPGLAAPISTALVIVTILLPVTFITLAVVNELRGVVAFLQERGPILLDPNAPYIGPLLQWAGQYVDVERFRSEEFLLQRIETVGNTVASRTVGLVGGVLTTVVQVFLVVFVMYYLFRDGENIRHAAYEIVPLSREQSRRIVERTHEVISASIYGVLTIAAIQGTLGTVIFWVLGLPSPLLWGVVMFFLSMIPMAGSFLVWVPAAIYLAFSGEFVRAGVLVAWGLLVIGSIDNFLAPRLVGARTRLHELFIFFSVLGGIQAFGVIGVVLGPVLTAVTLALIEIVRQATRPPEEPPAEPTLLEHQADFRKAAP